jgi:hypothetical protein
MLADHEMVDTLNTCLPKRLLLTALASACLLSVAIVGKASAQEELTAKFILEMPPNQSSEGIPVTLQGVVTEAVEQGMVVHDGTAGSWVYFDDSQRFHPGDLLQLTGKIARGMFAPVINASSVHRIGTAPMPRPTPATYIQLSSGDKDGNWSNAMISPSAVTVEGHKLSW